MTTSNKVCGQNCLLARNFAHNPEPLPEHLTDISEHIRTTKADVGFVVDPDVDRLAIVCENGEMFGEEYTLVSIADYVLTHTPGNTVSNLSSTRALADITAQHGGQHNASAVGEVNVVAKIRETNAVIGGEGNGGVIYPASHCGRDALVGVALFLTHLAKKGKTVSQLRAEYPNYYMPLLDTETVERAIKIGACNVYHGCVHNMLHEKSEEILKSLYKSASFVVQAIVYQQTGRYFRHQAALLEAASAQEKEILQAFMLLKNGGAVELEAMSERLFLWAKQWA